MKLKIVLWHHQSSVTAHLKNHQKIYKITKYLTYTEPAINIAYDILDLCHSFSFSFITLTFAHLCLLALEATRLLS